MKPAGKYLHFEGTYRGVYRAGSVRSNLGAHTFKSIDWVWLEVTPTKSLLERNFEEETLLSPMKLPLYNLLKKLYRK